MCTQGLLVTSILSLNIFLIDSVLTLYRPIRVPSTYLWIYQPFCLQFEYFHYLYTISSSCPQNCKIPKHLFKFRFFLSVYQVLLYTLQNWCSWTVQFYTKIRGENWKLNEIRGILEINLWQNLLKRTQKVLVICHQSLRVSINWRRVVPLHKIWGCAEKVCFYWNLCLGNNLNNNVKQ